MRVFKCTDKTAPYPPEQTKVITKKVGRKTRVNLSGVDMRVPLDISVVVKKTLTGQKTIVVGQAERNAARRKYAGANVLLVEYYPVSMTGTGIIPTPILCPSGIKPIICLKIYPKAWRKSLYEETLGMPYLIHKSKAVKWEHNHNKTISLTEDGYL